MKPNYHTLIFEGGGVKGYSYPFALEAVINAKLIDLACIDRFVGTSAGAIIAGLLACGADVDFIRRALDVDFSAFEDDSFGCFRDMRRIYKKYGKCEGKFFSKWYQGLIGQLTGDPMVTLGELRRKVVIVATDLNRRKMHLFTNYTDPNIPLYLAVRASISIPLFFVPVQIDDTYYVDGGLLGNYHDPQGHGGELGFRLVSNSDRQDFHHIEGPVDFGDSICEVLLVGNEKRHISKELWENTINIDTGNIKATEFSLTLYEKLLLEKNGRAAAEKFISKVHPTYEFIR